MLISNLCFPEPVPFLSPFLIFLTSEMAIKPVFKPFLVIKLYSGSGHDERMFKKRKTAEKPSIYAGSRRFLMLFSGKGKGIFSPLLSPFCPLEVLTEIDKVDFFNLLVVPLHQLLCDMQINFTGNFAILMTQPAGDRLNRYSIC